jgi:hypothetical protein
LTKIAEEKGIKLAKKCGYQLLLWRGRIMGRKSYRQSAILKLAGVAYLNLDASEISAELCRFLSMIILIRD